MDGDSAVVVVEDDDESSRDAMAGPAVGKRHVLD
jgi:hypothetical protein